jgi:hypothetical protein
MEKEKVLEIEFKEVWDNKWAWRIIKNKVDFKNTSGEISFGLIKLTCSIKYDLYIFDTYSLKWELLNSDNLLDFDLKTDIQDFVNYVNKKYGIPKIERANKGEKYYIIDSLGRVIDFKEIYDTSDNEYYNLGNYFKSIETAIKFRDTIWKNTWVLRKEIYKD